MTAILVRSTVFSPCVYFALFRVTVPPHSLSLSLVRNLPFLPGAVALLRLHDVIRSIY